MTSYEKLGCVVMVLGVYGALVDTAVADPSKKLLVKPSTPTRIFTKGYARSLYGIGCTPVVKGAKTCGNVHVVDTANIGNQNSIPIDPPYESLSADVGEYYYTADQEFYSSYRWISCKIKRSALTELSISNFAGRLTVTIDPSSPDCSGFGQLYDPATETYSMWDFGGAPIVVQAQMTSARFSVRSTTSGSIADNQHRAAHKYTCNQSVYNQATGVISFNGNSFVMFNTGGQDNYDNFGMYHSVQCKDVSTTK